MLLMSNFFIRSLFFQSKCGEPKEIRKQIPYVEAEKRNNCSSIVVYKYEEKKPNMTSHYVDSFFASRAIAMCIQRVKIARMWKICFNIAQNKQVHIVAL